jgi:hypothetical protein
LVHSLLEVAGLGINHPDQETTIIMVSGIMAESIIYDAVDCFIIIAISLTRSLGGREQQGCNGFIVGCIYSSVSKEIQGDIITAITDGIFGGWRGSGSRNPPQPTVSTLPPLTLERWTKHDRLQSFTHPRLSLTTVTTEGITTTVETTTADETTTDETVADETMGGRSNASLDMQGIITSSTLINTSSLQLCEITIIPRLYILFSIDRLATMKEIMLAESSKNVCENQSLT